MCVFDYVKESPEGGDCGERGACDEKTRVECARPDINLKIRRVNVKFGGSFRTARPRNRERLSRVKEWGVD